MVNFVQFGNKFGVSVEELRPALDKPLVDFFYKGKEYYFVFARDPTGQEISGQGSMNGNRTEWIALRAHHGMEGHWTFDHPDTLANYHYRLDFSWNLEEFAKTGIPDVYLYYQNERFGQIEILPSIQRVKESVERLANGFLGRFILSEAEWMVSYSSLGKDRYLRLVLMDQSELCSGIGMYLLVEILYAAKLHPDVLVGQLSLEEVRGLYYVCTKIINGHYTKTLEKVIYKKKISPGGHPISYMTKGNRKIHYSPNEQISEKSQGSPNFPE